MINSRRGQKLYEEGRKALVQLRYFHQLAIAEAIVQGWTVDSVQMLSYETQLLGLLATIKENTSTDAIAPIKEEEPEKSDSSLGGSQSELPF